MVLQLKPQSVMPITFLSDSPFIRDFLSGNEPYNSPEIGPAVAAPQADIFYHYKQALRHVMAVDKATAAEEIRAKKESRQIDPENIDELTPKYLDRLPYKAHGCRYHSFVTYFSTLQKLGWVEPTGQEEPSSFQDNYPEGQSRKYFRLTAAGIATPDYLWANPHKALYGD